MSDSTLPPEPGGIPVRAILLVQVEAIVHQVAATAAIARLIADDDKRETIRQALGAIDHTAHELRRRIVR